MAIYNIIYDFLVKIMLISLRSIVIGHYNYKWVIIWRNRSYAILLQYETNLSHAKSCCIRLVTSQQDDSKMTVENSSDLTNFDDHDMTKAHLNQIISRNKFLCLTLKNITTSDFDYKTLVCNMLPTVLVCSVRIECVFPVLLY